jgi:hypothetical protein
MHVRILLRKEVKKQSLGSTQKIKIVQRIKHFIPSMVARAGMKAKTTNETNELVCRQTTFMIC